MVKLIINLLTFWILPKAARHEARRKLHNIQNRLYKSCFVYAIRRKISKSIEKIAAKYQNGQKIKVAFLQQFITSNQNFSLYEMMLNSVEFDPYFIVNPDCARSKEHAVEAYDRCYDELCKKYGIDRVLHGWIDHGDTYIDYTDQFDIAFTANPYEAMAHDYFKIDYWVRGKNIPMFYIPYFYWGRCMVFVDNLRSSVMDLFYQIFIPNQYCKKMAQKYQFLKGRNMKVVGYPKMDELATRKSKKDKARKMVILAPHHSIGDVYAKVGSFLETADIFLELVKRYPQVDFVFRPHPLLKQNLVKPEYWGRAKTEAYFEEMLSQPNVSYSTDGEYLQIFSDSDAMIHDCGSYMCEYLYTGNPFGYCYRSDASQETWTDLGERCLAVHHPLRTRKDYFDFMEEVVLKERDSLRDARIRFASEMVIYNHPNATHAVLQELKSALTLQHRNS